VPVAKFQAFIREPPATNIRRSLPRDPRSTKRDFTPRCIASNWHPQNSFQAGKSDGYAGSRRQWPPGLAAFEHHEAEHGGAEANGHTNIHGTTRGEIFQASMTIFGAVRPASAPPLS
jgi:hypothetical protein